MRIEPFCLVLLLSLCWCGEAAAACNATPIVARWHFGEVRTLYWRTSQGAICATDLGPAASTQMSSLRIVRRAAHGMAGREGLSGIAYQPSPGFKGVDTFSFAFSGTGSQSRGTTTFNVQVTVD
jgi:hypothetical protein